MVRVSLIFIAIFLNCLETNAQECKLFLVAGQSNAVGVGNADSSVICSQGTCFEYISAGDSLRPLRDPVGYSSPTEDFQAAFTGSAWPSFAYNYNLLTGDTVIVVQAAKGATSCAAAADAGAGNWSSSYHLFAQAVTKAKMAETHTGVQLSGIIWLQGESDAVGIFSGKISACQYEDALQDLIGRFRSTFRCNLPFYIIQTGLFTSNYDQEFYMARQVQRQVADIDPLTFVVDSITDTYRALGWMNTDQIHYGQKALNTIGATVAKNIRQIELTANLDSCYYMPQPILSPDWDVFPSPFTNELSLEIRNCNCAEIELSITDMLGRTVYKTSQNSLTLVQPALKIATASFQRGAYIVHVVLNKQWVLTKRLIKN